MKKSLEIEESEELFFMTSFRPIQIAALNRVCRGDNVASWLWPNTTTAAAVCCAVLARHPCLKLGAGQPSLNTCVVTMPPKKRNCAPALSVRHLSESQDDDIELHDESSDSEFDDDPVSRQIGRDAARDTLGPRSREHYARYQNAMVSWALKQNLSLSVEKRYKVHVPFSYRLVAT